MILDSAESDTSLLMGDQFDSEDDRSSEPKMSKDYMYTDSSDDDDIEADPDERLRSTGAYSNICVEDIPLNVKVGDKLFEAGSERFYLKEVTEKPSLTRKNASNTQGPPRVAMPTISSILRGKSSKSRKVSSSPPVSASISLPTSPHTHEKQKIHREFISAISCRNIPLVMHYISERADPLYKVDDMDGITVAASVLPAPDATLICLLLRAAILCRGPSSVENSLATGHLRQSLLQAIAKSLSRHIYGHGRRYTNRELSSNILNHPDIMSDVERMAAAEKFGEDIPLADRQCVQASPVRCRLDDTLRLACFNGDIEYVQHVLGQMKDDGEVDTSSINEPRRVLSDELCAVDEEGNTLLHWAVNGKHMEIISSLLCFGADPDLRDQLGRTPLHIAADLSRKDMLLILLYGYSMKHGGIDEAVEKMTGIDPVSLKHTTSQMRTTANRDSFVQPFVRRDLQRMCRLLEKSVYGSGKQLRNEQLAESLFEAAQAYAANSFLTKDPKGAPFCLSSLHKPKKSVTISVNKLGKSPILVNSPTALISKQVVEPSKNLNAIVPGINMPLRVHKDWLNLPELGGSTLGQMSTDRETESFPYVASCASSSPTVSLTDAPVAMPTSAFQHITEPIITSCSESFSISGNSPVVAKITDFPAVSKFGNESDNVDRDLYEAVSTNEINAVRGALKRGADPTTEIYVGKTALHQANTKDMTLILINAMIKRCQDEAKAVGILTGHIYTRTELQRLNRLLGLSIYNQDVITTEHKKIASGKKRLTNRALALNLCERTQKIEKISSKSSHVPSLIEFSKLGGNLKRGDKEKDLNSEPKRVRLAGFM